MSQGAPRRPKKLGRGSTHPTSVETQDITSPRPLPEPSLSANSAPNLGVSDTQASRHSSDSSDGSSPDTSKSVVSSIVDELNARIQVQLGSFLANEIASSLTALRTEMTAELQESIKLLTEAHNKELAELHLQLDEQAKEIRKQDEWLAREPEVMSQVITDPSDFIVLNVGGMEYATSRATLCKYPQSMLGAMFSGRYASLKDSQGRYFIDRDGSRFRSVLGFLRTGSLSSIDTANQHLLVELLEEATYFQLEPLIELVQAQITRQGPDSLANATSSSSLESSRYSSPVSPNSLSTKALNHKKSKNNGDGDVAIATFSREHIVLLKIKHDRHNSRGRLNLAGLDLSGVDLSKLDLRNIDFSRCNLTGASFEGAILTGSLFIQATLKQANFQQAFVGSTEPESPNFTDADLYGADFTRYVGILYRSHFEGVEDEMVGVELRWLRG